MDEDDAGDLVELLQGTDDGVILLKPPQLSRGVVLPSPPLRMEADVAALKVDGIVAYEFFHVLVDDVPAVDGGVPVRQPLVQRRHGVLILCMLVRLGAVEILRQDVRSWPSDDGVRITRPIELSDQIEFGFRQLRPEEVVVCDDSPVPIVCFRAA